MKGEESKEEPLPGLYDQPNPCDNAVGWLLFFNWPTAMIKLERVERSLW